jgi:hypothetical protein
MVVLDQLVFHQTHQYFIIHHDRTLASSMQVSTGSGWLTSERTKPAHEATFDWYMFDDGITLIFLLLSMLQ